MKIELAKLDLSGYTTGQQALKVMEEFDELMMEQIGEIDTNAVAEEAFDLMQAVYGYLRMIGVDITTANEQHMEKMHRRYGNATENRA